MKFKIKPLMLGALVSTTAILSGCGSDETQPEIIDVFQDVGLWCKSPDIVQTASPDFYPLTQVEKDAIAAGKSDAKAQALAAAGGTWTAEEEATWEAEFKYESLDLYAILGLTLEEKARQAIAKEEARAFQIENGQDVIRGEDFDTWFDTWFDAIPPANYLGASQRINRSVNATTPEMDGEEICYTPPLSCPNYKEIDPTGTYECIIPEENPIEDAPAPAYLAGTDEAVIYYRNEEHVAGGNNHELYANVVIHTWNNDDCTAYADNSISDAWGISGADQAGIDDNYGVYWIVDLVEEPSNCANLIINDTKLSEKKISENDLTMPLGPSGDITLHNLDKNSYTDDHFAANGLDGLVIINQHPYYGAEASGGLKSCGWGLTTDETGEQCVGEELSEELACPAETVAVGVGTIDIASKCVALFEPSTTSLLLRGAFNNWGDSEDANFAASHFEYTGEGQYRVNFPYMVECEVVAATEETEAEDCVTSFEFKVADLDWSEPSSFGSIKDGDQSAVGSTITMTVGKDVGQNMKVDFTANNTYQFIVDAADPAAVTLTINEVPVDAFPMLTLGSETTAMQYSSNGNYMVRLELTAGDNSFTIADPTTGFAVGAIGTDNIVTENTPLALVADGGALSFTADAAEYDFILNLSDPAAPTIEVKPALPWGATPVFIRGSVNGWSSPADDEMIWDSETRTYSVIYGLEADGNHAFKFADANWSTYNLGYADVTFAAEGETITDDGGNMTVSVAKSTSYKFEVSFATATPEVKVMEAPLYLRGNVTTSEWGADAGNQLAFVATDAGNAAETSHVYSIEVNHAGGEGMFKIADEGWGGTFGYDFGSADDDNVAVELGVEKALKFGGANMTLDLPAGTYLFSFYDGKEKSLTITAK